MTTSGIDTPDGADANNANDTVATDVPMRTTGTWCSRGASMSDGADRQPYDRDLGRTDLMASPESPPTPPARYLTETGAANTAQAGRASPVRRRALPGARGTGVPGNSTRACVRTECGSRPRLEEPCPREDWVRSTSVATKKWHVRAKP
jgi:hypothetical protein